MTPLVLLPGMMCDARLFAPQIAALSGRRAVHYAPIGGHDSVHALACEVLEHAPPRFALAGLSMGGIVAMEVMAQAPERITHLALLDTNPRAELPEVQARRGPQMEAVRAGRLRAVMRDEMKPNYLIDSPQKPAILDTCMDMALSLGADVFIRQSIALRNRPDQQDTLCAVAVPTLILCGSQDRLCPLERHELMHALIPGSRLAVIDEAAHLPTLEQPDAVNAALAKWLED
jgi:pimeloyl-ACP methyl ester carboxylesterase